MQKRIKVFMKMSGSLLWVSNSSYYVGKDNETQNLADNIESHLNSFKKGDKDKKGRSNISWALLKAFKPQVLTAVLLSSISDYSNILNLFFTSFFISWLKDEDAPPINGYFYAFILGFLMLISAWTRNFFMFHSSCAGINVRKGLSGLLYRKMLKFNQKSKALASTGKIVGIISGELQLVERGMIIVPALVTAPITLIFGMVVLSFIFKEAVIFGFIVSVIIIFSEFVSAKYINKFKYREGFYSDKRLKTISDIVNGIRTIKAYAWEVPFRDLVNKYRSKMLSSSMKNQIIEALMWGVAGGGGYIVGVAIFGYHWGMGRELEYEDSLAGIAMCGYLSIVVFHQMFMSIVIFSNLLAILKRVGEVLDMDEFIDSRETLEENTKDGPQQRIRIENFTATWGFSIKKDLNVGKNKIEENLNDTNLEIPEFSASDGDLTAIVGPVGCGKSTFLSSIMNELVTKQGKVSIFSYLVITISCSWE